MTARPDSWRSLTADDERHLLLVARLALDARVRRLPAPEPVARGPLDEPAAAFVTIRSGPQLRGCLGSLARDMPLGETVARLAALVADADPRFPPVTAGEVDTLSIEISVLGPERLVATPDEVEPGRHGVILEHEGRRGLLLPHVATEHGWDRETLLEQVSRKAGLDLQAWRAGALLVFEAHVFGDRERRG